MKKISLYFVLMAIGILAYSQKIDKSQVPLQVKTMFQTKVNDTLTPTWQKSGDEYFADYTKGEMNGHLVFGPNGEWKKTVWTIPYQYVPQKIKDNVLTAYAGFKVSKSTIEQRADGDNYVIEAKKKKEVQTMVYTMKGEFVKVEPKPEVAAEPKK